MLTLGIASGEIRTWTDTTGKFKVEAEFVALEDGQVTLRGATGKTKKIPLNKLSEADRKVAEGLAAVGKAGPLDGGLDTGEIGQSLSFDLPGGEKLVMKYCPGGKFMMGSPEGEKDRMDNEAHVEVELSSHYWIAETECTQGQWKALMGHNGSEFKGDRLPVEMENWELVQVYVRELNEKVKPPASWEWSLPTEAQWERACRAGTTTAYSFGDDDSAIEAYAWYRQNSEKRTHPVGTREPNPWGLYDMHGNVEEWCLDPWDVADNEPGRAFVDPLDPTNVRVVRGSAWDSYASSSRCAYRGEGFPATASGKYVGFRVVLTPVQP